MPGLDTQIIFAFNPKDKHHSRAVKFLKILYVNSEDECIYDAGFLTGLLQSIS